MYINKKIILGTILILALTYFGTSFNNMVAKLWIGNVTITDTLTGSAKFNHGIYADSLIYCSKGLIYAGDSVEIQKRLRFTGGGNSIYLQPSAIIGTDRSGASDMFFTNQNNKAFKFVSGVNTVLEADSLKGVNIKSHLTMPTVATPTDPADTELKIYVKGAKLIYHYKASTTDYFYYISLTATADQHWIYSATEP